MGPKAVISCRDTETCHEIPEHSEHKRFPTKGRKERANDTNHWGHGEHDEMKPIELVAPI